MPLTALPASTGKALPATAGDASPMRLYAIFVAETGGTNKLTYAFNDKPDNSGTTWTVDVPAGTSKEIAVTKGIPLHAGLYVTISGTGTPSGAVVWE